MAQCAAKSCYPVDHDVACLNGLVIAAQSGIPSNTTECPSSLFDPLGGPKAFHNEFKNATTMVLDGIEGPDDSRYGVWVLSQKPGSKSPKVTLSCSTKSRTLYKISLWILSDTGIHWRFNYQNACSFFVHCGMDAAFHWEDPFLADAVEPYLAALHEVGGPFCTITGVQILF
jgi:hypothetical protein